MKKTIALLLLASVLASLAAFALAEGTEDLVAQVEDCGYKIISFSPSTREYTDPADTEGMAAYSLVVEITKEPAKYITYHPNLAYDGGEAGVRVRALDMGGGVSASMGFNPEELYQTEGVSVATGGRITYDYLIPEGKEPLQVIFYDGSQQQAAAFEVAAIPAAE